MVTTVGHLNVQRPTKMPNAARFLQTCIAFAVFSRQHHVAKQFGYGCRFFVRAVKLADIFVVFHMSILSIAGVIRLFKANGNSTALRESPHASTPQQSNYTRRFCAALHIGTQTGNGLRPSRNIITTVERIKSYRRQSVSAYSQIDNVGLQIIQPLCRF